ncbi:MAG: hypothetical protein ACKO96_40940 [Flammeovirgaceae bacterium]
MNDPLKDFVTTNRKEFDDKTPRETTWSEIEAALHLKKKSKWNSVTVWRSAAIVLLGMVIYLAGVQNGKTNIGNKRLSSEFKDLDTFYNDQIIEKAELVSQFQREGTGEVDDDITQNLKKLEAMYQVLKEEMKKRPTQDVRDALVLNLLVRIDLLNQHLQKLDSKVVKNSV